jgi:preprotein translocase subunit SecE
MAEAKKADKKPVKKTDPKKSAKNQKPSAFRRILKYLASCKGEIKKITWPTPAQTTKNFGIVIAVIIIMGLFIFGLDTGLYAILGLIMGTGTSA